MQLALFLFIVASVSETDFKREFAAAASAFKRSVSALIRKVG